MFNIAIDGHAGSGKSTIAKEIAKKLKIKLLDTGAIYRGLACAFLESKYKELNLENVSKFAANVIVKIDFEGDKQLVFVNGKDYTPFLRKEEISLMASKISAYPQIRNKMLDIQRDFAFGNDCVMEGRDIGTVVIPHAKVKIFITADVKIRAKRRYEQLQDKSNTTLEQVLKDLRDRDFNDENRETAPLKPAKDSIILDNSNLNIEQTVDKCIEIIKEETKSL